jgi:hypothetical protein
VVEAHLDARLFGLRVLRVDGTVLLAPGHLVEPMAPTRTAELARGADLALAARLLAENRARLDGTVPRRLGPAS